MSIFSFQENKPLSTWPTEGSIVFEKMCFSYSRDTEPVLKNISCNISAKEKVNDLTLVGRGMGCKEKKHSLEFY